MVIYKVVNTINGKVYVGQTTKSLDVRKKQHIREASSKKYSAYNSKLHRAIRKYGLEYFQWDVIEETDSLEILNKKEIEYIAKYNSIKSGYNICIGGKGGAKYARTQTTREKISKTKKEKYASGETIPSMLGKNHSEKSKEKISITRKKLFAEGKLFPTRVGEKHSEETKKKMSENSYWNTHTFSKEHRKKLSISLSGRKPPCSFLGKNHSEETKKKMSNTEYIKNKKIHVYQYSLEGNFLRVFDSFMDAVRFIINNTKYKKATHQNIRTCCRNLSKSVYGFKWSLDLYKDGLPK